jgi:hypothetical protein
MRDLSQHTPTIPSLESPAQTEALAPTRTLLSLSQRQLQEEVHRVTGIEQPIGHQPRELDPERVKQLQKNWDARVSTVHDLLKLELHSISANDVVALPDAESEPLFECARLHAHTFLSSLDLVEIDEEEFESIVVRPELDVSLVTLDFASPDLRSEREDAVGVIELFRPTSAVRDDLQSSVDKVSQRAIISTLDTTIRQPEFFDIRSLSHPPKIRSIAGCDVSLLQDLITSKAQNPGDFLVATSGHAGFARIDGKYYVMDGAGVGECEEDFFYHLLSRLSHEAFIRVPETLTHREDVSHTLASLIKDEGVYYLKSTRSSGGAGIVKITFADGDLRVESESPDTIHVFNNMLDHYRQQMEFIGTPGTPAPMRARALASLQGLQEPLAHLLGRYIASLDCPILERAIPAELVFDSKERAEFRIIIQDGAITGAYTKVSPSDIAANISLSGRGETISTVVADIVARRLPHLSPEEQQTHTAEIEAEIRSSALHLGETFAGELAAMHELSISDYAIDLIPSWDESTNTLDLYFLEVQYSYAWTGLQAVDPEAAALIEANKNRSLQARLKTSAL